MENIKHTTQGAPLSGGDFFGRGRVVDYLNSKEELADSEDRRRYFGGLGAEEMLGHVKGVGSLFELEDYGGEFSEKGVEAELFGALTDEDKSKLITHAWSAIRGGVLQNDDYSASQALRYAGLSMGGALAVVRPFGGENEAISRVVAWEIMNGSELTDEDAKELTSENGRNKLHIRSLHDFSQLDLRSFGGAFTDRLSGYLSEEEIDSYQNDNLHSDDERRRYAVAGFMAMMDLVAENPSLPVIERLRNDSLDARIRWRRAAASHFRGLIFDGATSEEEKIGEYWERLGEFERAAEVGEQMRDYMHSKYGEDYDETSIPYLEQVWLNSLIHQHDHFVSSDEG